MISKSALWIGMPEAHRGRSVPLFRREFHIDQEIVSAKLSICGLGCYEAYLNGERVGDHVLDPAQTDYEIRALYSTYDVAALLRTGANAIGAMLGDGWFSQNVVWSGKMSYGSPRLVATLEVQLAGGSKLELSTDGSWLCAKGPVTASNLYAGESYDARLERPGWSSSGFEGASSSKWWLKWLPCEIVEAPCFRLEEQLIPPMRRIEELRPVQISEAQPGCWIADMGQNFSGWLGIKVEALAGTCIRLRFAEAISPNGMLDTGSSGVFATGVEQVDTYICKGGGVETWEPRFTCHGFRYVEILGWPGKPGAADLVGVVVHTALRPAGSFECSDARLNLLHRMAVWTHRSNIHGFPEDCPVRERCGWLGDAHVICEYSFYNFDGDSFWLKYLDDIESSRLKNGGLPTYVAPGKRHCGLASPDWMAALILIPWAHYVHYGKRDVLERHWEGMRAVIEHMKSLSDGWLLPHGLGDWFDPGQRAQPSYTPPVKTSTLIFGDCARIMSKASSLLGRGEDSVRYAEWSSEIRAAFQKSFYDRDSRSFGSQTADAMALQLGFAPQGQEAAIADSIAKDALARDTHFTVGIMGLKCLFEVLTRYGHGELALALLRQDSYPSFGDLINRGATTTWEYWGEKEVDDVHGPRSLSHPMMAGYDSWFFNTLAGIRPDPEHPGFDQFFLEPHPIQGVSWMKCVHDCRHGRISSFWTLKDGLFSWSVVVPEGSKALARLPGSSEFIELAPGGRELQAALPFR